MPRGPFARVPKVYMYMYSSEEDAAWPATKNLLREAATQGGTLLTQEQKGPK